MEACRGGLRAKLGSDIPACTHGANSRLRIRARFLRFLLLGGDHETPVHDRGVRLEGAFIEGRVDLGGCRIPQSVILNNCLFLESFFAQDAKIAGLFNLSGSWLMKGMNADRLQCGGLFLRKGFHSTGLIRLIGAHIKGDLECDEASFEGTEGVAFTAERATVDGSVFFRSKFKAIGTVRILGARIGGNLECIEGHFDGQGSDSLMADRAVVGGNVFLRQGFTALGRVRLHAMQITGELSCRNAQFVSERSVALSTLGASVGGIWHFRQLKSPIEVDARHMRVAVLNDASNSWAKGSLLDGFTYGTLGGFAPTGAADRLAWLRQQRSDHLGEPGNAVHFRPQPWRKIRAVLREMGHAEDARQLGIEFERHLRRIDRIGIAVADTSKLVAASKRFVARSLHSLFGALAGYGYRPMRLLAWMVGVWLCCGFAFWYLALPPHHAIGPSDPLVYQNNRYSACGPSFPVAASSVPEGGGWYLCSAMPAEYSTFSPMAYSLDVLLPFVNLGQENAWGPMVPTPKARVIDEFLSISPGHVVRLLVWFENLFGWIAGALLVGIVSGFARRTEE